MRIATILFTYNRPYHTNQVLSYLRNSYILPDMLYVFHDGPKENCKMEDWNKVDSIIRKIDWCECMILSSKNNKGLAKSVIEGINYVLNDFDAVIVLEDDCIPAKGFMNYMYEGLIKYENDKEAWGITGFSWPINMEKNTDVDVYACGRIATWGWGTWKNRWMNYKKDINIVDRIRSTPEGSIMLDTWGSDLDNMLENSVKKKNDSWAVYWALQVIESKGYYITPYESLIQNIGFDGSGTNCGRDELFESYSNMLTEKRIFRFPNRIEIQDNVRYSFSSFKGSRVALGISDFVAPAVIVYGTGSLYREKEDQILSKYRIALFIDNKKRGYYGGIRIISSRQLFPEIIDNIGIVGIIVMIRDENEKRIVIRELVDEVGIQTKYILGV